MLQCITISSFSSLNPAKARNCRRTSLSCKAFVIFLSTNMVWPSFNLKRSKVGSHGHWYSLNWFVERERGRQQRGWIYIYLVNKPLLLVFEKYNPFGKFDLSAEFLTSNISLNNGECFPCQFHPALIFATTRFSIIFNKLINLHGYF